MVCQSAKWRAQPFGVGSRKAHHCRGSGHQAGDRCAQSIRDAKSAGEADAAVHNTSAKSKQKGETGDKR